jgi:hypothetical protein
VSRRWKVLVLVAVILLAGGAAAAFVTTGGRDGRSFLGDAAVRAPADVRIKVEVLNATRVRGLARRATLHLRDRGFDVVEMGTAAEQRDSTLVLDRTGSGAWAQLVAEAMGTGAVETRVDTSRYLDVTVLIGADWTPPAEPFYP